MNALMQPDVLVAAQYFGTRGRNPHLEPEKRLMLAVLEDAVVCFLRFFVATDRKGQAVFHDAEEWIMDGSSDWPFSFGNTCAVLGLDPYYLREGLVRCKRKKLARRILQPGDGKKPCRRLSRAPASNRSRAASFVVRRRWPPEPDSRGGAYRECS